MKTDPSDDLYQIASPEGNVIAITAPGRQQHPNRLPRNPQPAGCRQRSCRQDYRSIPTTDAATLVSITDPAGYTTCYGYNAQWLPETITDALGKTRRLHSRHPRPARQASPTVPAKPPVSVTPNTAISKPLPMRWAKYHLATTMTQRATPSGTDYPDGSHETFGIRPPQPSDCPHRRTRCQNRLRTLQWTDCRSNAPTRWVIPSPTLYDKARRSDRPQHENGETYRLDYDQTDNLIQETGWDGKITAYGYDVAGQLVQQTEYGQK